MNALFISLWSITLAWSPPALNVDGSLIDDLAGFYVYQASTADLADAAVVGTLTNGVTRVPTLGQSYQLEITPGTNDAYFAATAFDLGGNESVMSEAVHWFDAPPGPPIVRVTIAVTQ